MVSHVSLREEILKLFLQWKIHPVTLDHIRLNVLLTANWKVRLNSTGAELPVLKLSGKLPDLGL